MATDQSFGGDWTEDKLYRLGSYLRAYVQVFKNQPHIQTVYIDAFAGTGFRRAPSSASNIQIDEEGSETPDGSVQEFLKGSARVALEIEPHFNRYIFIERNSQKCLELEKLKNEYPHLSSRIQIENADADTYISQWCQETNWKSTRAVMFLDPFGMQVEWSLLEKIADTKSIDLWLLVPIGMGANRLMPREGLPPPAWQRKLTLFFGNDDWSKNFYGPKQQPGLFDKGDEREKTASPEEIAAYFVSRLNEIFVGVADNPLIQRNSKKAMLFLLCFATGSERGKPIALRIARHILK